MNRPEPDLSRIIASLAAQIASARRSGLRLADRAGQSEPQQHLRETLEDIRSDLGNCSRCGLCRGRNTLVFGQGSPQARLVFVGTAPTPTDDAEGRPFCGAEGEMLANIITRVLGLSPADVYLTHIVKCAPPGGRPPLAEEGGTCLPFLFRQLAAIGPAIVCALGEAAAQALLTTQDPLAELRGSIHSAAGFPVIATHDLSFLVLHPDKKRETMQDLKLILRELKKIV
jgi:uracil-DNA glycosylase